MTIYPDDNIQLLFNELHQEMVESVLRQEAAQWREWFPDAPPGRFDPYDPVQP